MRSALLKLQASPAANAFGTALVTVLAHDNGGVGLSGADTSTAQTFRITITPTNSAPVANADAFTVIAGQQLNDVSPGRSGSVRARPESCPVILESLSRAAGHQPRVSLFSKNRSRAGPHQVGHDDNNMQPDPRPTEFRGTGNCLVWPDS